MWALAREMAANTTRAFCPPDSLAMGCKESRGRGRGRDGRWAGAGRWPWREASAREGTEGELGTPFGAEREKQAELGPDIVQ